MKTIHYILPVLAVAIAAVWFTSQNRSSSKTEEENPILGEAGSKSRPYVATGNQPAKADPKNGNHRKPDATLAPASVLPDPERRKEFSDAQLGKLAVDWLRTDPAAAWLQSLPDDYENGAFIARIADAALQLDPAATLAWIEALPEGLKKRACREALLMTVISRIENQDAFESKLATLPATWHDGAHLNWLGQGQFSKDLKASADQLTMIFTRNPEMVSSMAGKRARAHLLSFYGSRGNFNDGMAWAMALPDEKSRADNVATLAEEWSRQDSPDAALWINSLPKGNIRDAAATALVNAVQGEDPSSALAWAKSISNEEARRKQIHNVYVAWLRNNPLEATEAIQSLTQEERQHVFAGKTPGEE